MLNTQSIDFINKASFSESFIKPLYHSYCFSNIPGTIISSLGVKTPNQLPKDVLPKARKYKKVILLFIDSFGWEFWQKYSKKFKFLQRFTKQGVVSKITSQFPSTTSAHITTIHTGLEIGQSGIYEWFYYEPKVDAIIAPLLFSFAGPKERDTLKSTNIKPSTIFPKQTVYKQLKKHGVKSYIFQYKDYTPSAYSDIVFKGNTQIFPYRSLAHGLSLLTTQFNRINEPAYFFYYYDLIDTAGHVNGPDSLVHQNEIYNLFTQLEDIFYKQIDKNNDTLLLLCADHGMASINPKTTYFLNKRVPQLKQYLKKNQKEKYLVPAGACRDIFLYIKEECLEKAHSLLEKKLKDIAEVYKVTNLIKQGFFGRNKPNKQFMSRVGNLVILPYNNQSVWWYEKDKFEQKYYGHHGGLTKEEMLTPLLALTI